LDLKKQNDETTLQYIWRLGSAKDSGVLNATWEDLTEIFNENLGQDYGSSAYRKPYGQAKAFYDEVFSKMESEEYNHELMMQRRKLAREKIQLRDERTAWNKQNYLAARVEQKLDYLEEQFQDIRRIEFENHPSPIIQNSDNDLLIILSDMHIGQTFNSQWGAYNSDIAKDRLGQYLEEILKIQKRHNSQNAYVSIQGDIISGNIHSSIAISNREDVIEQIKIAIEYITSFIYDLSNNFENVYITNASGNHSRINKKDEALHSERLDDLIGWTIDKLTKDIDNIHFLSDQLDVGIAKMNIRGKEYINVHGDYDNFNKTGVSNLCMMLGYIPYAITFGHLHVCTVDESNGVKMIRGGCFSGTGDTYTIEKRLKGKPSQMVCVCSKNGVDCFYPIELR